MRADLRFVSRSLCRSPAFLTAAVLSLALGIGANTAMFSLTDQILLRTLPVKDPQRLVLFKWTGQFIGGTTRGYRDSFSYPMFVDLRNANPGVFTGVAARYQDSVDIGWRGPAQRAVAELVSGNYFDVLGVTPAIGRTLTPDDDKVKNAEPYVVLGYGFWQSRFGGDPSILNRTIDLNGTPMTVVGVAQRGFQGFEALSPADVFVPLMMKTTVTPTWDHMERRNSIWLRVFGRLKPGISEQAALAALAPVYRAALESDLVQKPHDRDFAARYLKNKLQFTPAAAGFQQTEQIFAKPLRVLLAMVGTLLLIACVNVANLLVSRAAARQKEIAIRISLGATRGALVRLILLESTLLAVVGGTLGLFLSEWIAGALVAMVPFDNIATAIHTTPDARILAFTAGVTLLTALLFGLVPAFESTRPELAPILKDEAGSLSGAHGQTRVRRALVVSQVALSLLLLNVAGLFARSLYNLLSVNSGISTAHLLTFAIDPSMHRYSPARERTLLNSVEERLSHLPGVISAGASSSPVLANSNWQNTVHIAGVQPPAGDEMNMGFNQVMPGFFSTMGVPLLMGRELTERDTAGAPQVVIVNQTFAKRYFPHESPLGHHLGWFGMPTAPYEIVGVVGDMKNGDLKEDIRPWTYTAALQDEAPGEMTFYLRTAGDPLSAVSAVRRVIAQADAALPVYNVKTLKKQIGETHFIDRMFAALSAAFGGLATLLASVGLYGITAYAVARRTQEIGIRVALGAGRRDVLALVLREVGLLAIVGIAIGIPLALALGNYLQSQLYGLKGTDPLVISAAMLTIFLVSAVAGYIPARRAARIDPLRALRYE